jgi:hypothetical protein
MTDIGFLARFAYDHGTDPIDYAVSHVIQIHIDVYLTVCAARAEDPASFPGYVLEATLPALSRRILGDLMDAGWTPPALEAGPEATP